MGLDPQAQTEYGLSRKGREHALEAAREVAGTHGQRELASRAGVSLSELSAVLLGERNPSPSTLAKMCITVSRLQKEEVGRVEKTTSLLDDVKMHCRHTGLRRFARQAEMDPAKLNRLLKGRSKPSLSILMKLKKDLDRY